MRKRYDMDAFGYLKDVMMDPQSSPVPMMPLGMPPQGPMSVRVAWQRVREAFSGQGLRNGAAWLNGPGRQRVRNLRPSRVMSHIASNWNA